MEQGLEATGLSREEAVSLLAWWLEAGVDSPIQEEPRDWRAAKPPLPLTGGAGLLQAEHAIPFATPIDRSPPASRSGSTPATLDAFHAWLAESADLPLFHAGAARALPHGPAEAELMLLTGTPTPEDAAEGRPIGGDTWALTARMLRAVGLGPEAVYVTAMTCFSGIGTRFSAADSEACRDTVLKQVGLAAPKRLLLMGDAPAKLLLGQPMASARGRLHRVAGIPATVTFAPRQLLQNNGLKALAWADLLMIMGA